MTKLFDKYMKLLKKPVLTESEIISLKNRIGYSPFSLTNDEVDELTNKLVNLHCEYDITADQSDKGINYLREKCFKKNGFRRRTKQLEYMPNKFFRAIRKFDHFTFVGFIGNHYNYYSDKTQYSPVYRIHMTNGEYFDYYMDNNLNFQMA